MRLARPRHGTVVAYLALFVALGGSSFALGRSSAPSADAAAKRAKKIQATVRQQAVPQDTGGGISTATVECRSGELASGGGFVGGASSAAGAVTDSFPQVEAGKPTGWQVNFSQYQAGRQVYVICVKR